MFSTWTTVEKQSRTDRWQIKDKTLHQDNQNTKWVNIFTFYYFKSFWFCFFVFLAELEQRISG